jgi:photosystem II stability/assembly factor-like uncharacterized protein
MLRVLVWVIASLVCAQPILAQTWVMEDSGTTASLRGISVVDEKTAWASGSGGIFLQSSDGGKTWHADVVPGAESLDFRGIQAYTAGRAILMSSGDGAKSAIYETQDGGRGWKIWYSDPDEKGFFDAIALPEFNHGLLLGDPVGGTFALFTFNQEGTAFSRVKLPAALPGEGAFAASNTSLVIRGTHVWFGTGGPGAARVFRSADAGEHWDIAKTPIASDKDGAGIFSLAFADGNTGIAVGGDYTKPRESAHNVALTRDGGRT